MEDVGTLLRTAHLGKWVMAEARFPCAILKGKKISKSVNVVAGILMAHSVALSYQRGRVRRRNMPSSNMNEGVAHRPSLHCTPPSGFRNARKNDHHIAGTHMMFATVTK